WKGGQKGADTGIDGIVYLRTGRTKTDKAIIEVKGGETVGVDVVHKLKSVIERERALCGLLVALRSPSRQALTEAASAGFAEIDMGTGTARFPRIQVLSVEGLLAGTEHPRLPIIDSTVFKKAKREAKKTQGELSV
ncbi:MAG TPA: restriction endonuclease, partial [Propylenella sp.]